MILYMKNKNVNLKFHDVYDMVMFLVIIGDSKNSKYGADLINFRYPNIYVKKKRG